MAKIIDFPGAWFGKKPEPEAGGIDGPPPQEYSRWWRLGRDILRSTGASGLRLSQTGELPDELARRLYQAHIRPELEQDGRLIGSESDSPDIAIVHWMLCDLGLLKEKKGFLSKTRSGNALSDNPQALYDKFFDLVMSGMHWHHVPGDDPEICDRCQELAPTSLSLIGGLCADWTPAGVLMDAASEQLTLPETIEMAKQWYNISLHSHFEPLGLVQISCLRQDLRRWSPRDEEVKLTPLFTEFLGNPAP